MIQQKEVVLDDDEGKKEYERFWEGWTNIINSLSEEEYCRNLNLFRLEWDGKQKKSVTYVIKNWLNKYKEMFVLAWTNKIKHYDNVSTSIAESAHARLKLYFDTAAGSFVQCWNSAHLCSENEFVGIENAFEISTSKAMHRFRKEPMLKELIGFVSHKALDLLLDELGSISTVGLTADNCGCVMWQVNGLPCGHMLADFRHTHGFIPLTAIDAYWKQLSCTPPVLHRSTLDFYDLPEIKALKSRYDDSADNVRLVMQQGLKKQAFPQTTDILEPPVAMIRKGRPSKKDRSTKRDPSYYEHVDAQLSCGSNLTPVSRYLKKLGVSTKKGYENKPFQHKYLSQIPKHMEPYILDIQDMPSDGNCGYWVVVEHLNLHNRRPDNPCKFVRESMLDNLSQNSEMYKRMWDECGFDEIKNRIQDTDFVGVDKWMQMPESGFIIAETFGTMVVLISKQICCTFVPTTVRVNLMNENRMVVMGYVDDSHFVGLKLTSASPLPPPPQFQYFEQFYNINAQDWVRRISDRISMYRAIARDFEDEDNSKPVDLSSC